MPGQGGLWLCIDRCKQPISLGQPWMRWGHRCPTINLPCSGFTVTLVSYSRLVKLHEKGTSRCSFAAGAAKAGLVRAEDALRYQAVLLGGETRLWNITKGKSPDLDPDKTGETGQITNIPEACAVVPVEQFNGYFLISPEKSTCIIPVCQQCVGWAKRSIAHLFERSGQWQASRRSTHPTRLQAAREAAPLNMRPLATRALISATDITCAVEAASITRVAR